MKGITMKKLAIVASLLFAGSVSAAELSASYVRDSNVDREGFRLEMSAGKLLGVKPTFGVTHVYDNYTRYSVGGDIAVTKVGPVAVALSGATLFQDTRTKTGVNGFGLTVGAKASVSLDKSADLVARVDRFVGQSRVNEFNGTTASIGVAVKF